MEQVLLQKLLWLISLQLVGMVRFILLQEQEQAVVLAELLRILEVQALMEEQDKLEVGVGVDQTRQLHLVEQEQQELVSQEGLVEVEQEVGLVMEKLVQQMVAKAVMLNLLKLVQVLVQEILLERLQPEVELEKMEQVDY